MKRQLDDGVPPSTPEQLQYVLDRIVRQYIKNTSNDNGEIKDLENHLQVIGCLEATRHSICRDYLDG